MTATSAPSKRVLLRRSELRDVGKQGHDRNIAPCPFNRGATGAEVPLSQQHLR